MKNLSILLILFSLTISFLHAQQDSVGISYAQVEAVEAIYPFIKKEKEEGNGLSIIIMGQPKNAEEVLEKKFDQVKGNKGKSKKGVNVYEKSTLPDVSPDLIDYYYYVEKASKKDHYSKITFFMSTGNYELMSSRSHPSQIRSAKQMLKNLGKEVRIYELQLAIEAQNDVVSAEEKTQSKLERDLENLEQDKLDIIQSIEENKQTQIEQKEEIVRQKEILSQLQAELNKIGN